MGRSLAEANSYIQTVEDNVKAYNRRELKEAENAVRFLRNAGFPSTKAAAEAINHGLINNLPCTTRGLYDAIRINGGDMVPGTMGKGKEKALRTR